MVDKVGWILSKILIDNVGFHKQSHSWMASRGKGCGRNGVGDAKLWSKFEGDMKLSNSLLWEYLEIEEKLDVNS